MILTTVRCADFRPEPTPRTYLKIQFARKIIMNNLINIIKIRNNIKNTDYLSSFTA